MILDLHIHSYYSEGSNLKPEIIIKKAKKVGLSGVAVTDYNTIQGALETRELNTDPDFHVIIGSQVRTDKGDVIGLFLSEDVSPGKFCNVVQSIRDQGGIVVFPHPNRNQTTSASEINSVDIIEANNARCNRYENIFNEECAVKFKKPCIAASDAHFETEIGNAITTVPGNTLGDIKENLLSGNFKYSVAYLAYDYLKTYSRFLKAYRRKELFKLIPLIFTLSRQILTKVDQKFVVTNVVPNDEMQKDLDKYQKYYTDWIWRIQHRQRINNVKNLLNRFSIAKDDKILEIGCGRGIYSTILAQKCTHNISLELSRREISIAKCFLQDKGLEKNVELILADAQHLPLKSNSFDFVMCVNVLEHLSDSDLGASELYRVLKKNHKALISMPNLVSYCFLKGRLITEVRNILRSNKIDIDSHMKFPYWKIHSICKDAGLKIIPLRGTHIFSGSAIYGFILNNFPSLMQLLNYIEWKFNIKSISAFYFLEGMK